MEERQIGATELRQRLTDVIQAVKEEGVAYVVETFGRPQVVVLDLEEYRRLSSAQPGSSRKSELAREAFGMWRDRADMDEEWLTRNRRWYSEWVRDNRDGE